MSKSLSNLVCPNNLFTNLEVHTHKSRGLPPVDSLFLPPLHIQLDNPPSNPKDKAFLVSVKSFQMG